jgi:hypothetical protein
MNSITGVPTWNNYSNYLTFNPVLVIILVVIILLYLLLFGSLGNGSSDSNYESIHSGDSTSNSLKFLGIIAASIFIVLIVINGFNYFLNIDITTRIRNFFSRNPEIDIVVNKNNLGGSIVPEIKYEEQVYHIPGNEYTYEDAGALCKAYGNRLANIKEVENAYEHGADWCSYGWSEGQMALFPTQFDRWEKLQKIKGHENDCGRPGINGGYIDNPNVRFGVNCYGYRPKMTPQEAELMKNAQLFPSTQEEINFEKRVDHWKKRIAEILVAPFNNKNWSMI